MQADAQGTELDLFWDISSWALQLQLMGSKACVLSFLINAFRFPNHLILKYNNSLEKGGNYIIKQRKRNENLLTKQFI